MATTITMSLRGQSRGLATLAGTTFASSATVIAPRAAYQAAQSAAPASCSGSVLAHRRLAPTSAARIPTLATIAPSSISSNGSNAPGSSPSRPAQALIVGAGPAGLAAAGVLTDQGLADSLIWADPVFNGGRVQERYREVPSNTKVHTFLDYARACAVFRDIEGRAGPGNAIGKLEELDQQKGCELGRAVDAAQVLIQGMLEREGVRKVVGEITAADWTADGVWKVTSASGETFYTERLVLATGSVPKPSVRPPGTSLTPLDLDDVLHPSTLHNVLPNPQNARIAVVGASHSAVLALRNLYNAGVPHLVNFARSDLKYAVYKEGYILYDNTGLKGVAADWAREHLEEEGPARDRGRITRVRLPGPEARAPSEEEVYARYLDGCSHILHAWGYVPRPIPRITASGLSVSGHPSSPSSSPADTDKDKEAGTVEFDHDSGRFWWRGSAITVGKREHVPRLFGCGIAFPARVTDPEGNVELAVGFIKFMKFLQSVKGQWAAA